MSTFETKRYTIYERTAWLCLISGMTAEATTILLHNKSPLSLNDLRQVTPPLGARDLFFASQSLGEDFQFYKKSDFWNNFDKFSVAMKAGGTPITAEFLHEKAGTDGSLLTCIYLYADYKKIFQPEIWEDNEKELIATHSCLQPDLRTQIDLRSILVKIAALKDEAYRPDIVKAILKRAETTMINVIEKGDIDYYEEALLYCGLEPHPDDVFVPYDLLKPNFESEEAGTHIDKWIALFKKYGHDIDANDLTRSYNKTSLINQLPVKSLEKLLKAENWTGNPDDMFELKDAINKEHPNEIVDKIFWQEYQKVEAEDIKLPFKIDENLTKTMLMTPIKDKNGKATHSIPLGSKDVWKNFNKIQKILTDKGTPIELRDLYKPVSRSNETALMRGVKWGYLYLALGLIDTDKNIYLNPDKCTKESSAQKNLIDYLMETNQLNELLDENLWIGNPKGLQKIWEIIPDCDEKAMIKDFDLRLSQVNRLTLLRARNKQKRTKSLNL